MSRVVCVWRGKRTYKHTHMLANVEKAQILRNVQKDHQRPSDAPKQNNFRETNLAVCVAGLAKSVEATPMLARIVPENKNVVPKHHSTNITPTSSRTAPQSYEKAPTSYICKPVSTNMVPTLHQKQTTGAAARAAARRRASSPPRAQPCCSVTCAVL